MRTAVERYDARVMDHLVENHHVSRRLEELHEVGVHEGDHGRPGVRPQDAPLEQTAVLRTVGAFRERHSLLERTVLGPRVTRRRVRRQRRNPPIRWIHDQRRALVLGDLRRPVKPEVIRDPAVSATHTLPAFCGRLLERRRFLIGQELSPGERAGSLQRRQGGVVPDALQIRRAPWRAGYGRWALSRLRGRKHRDHRHDTQNDACYRRGSAHAGPPWAIRRPHVADHTPDPGRAE